MFGNWSQKWKRWRRHSVIAPASRSAQSPPDPHSAQLQRHLEALRAPYLHALLGSGIDEPVGVPEKLLGQVVVQQLRDSEQRRSAVPRLPTVIPLLLKQLRDPNTSARDYVAIIRQDAVVASAMLTIANSVFFNPYRKPIDTFERAVTTLGLQGMRLVLSTAVLQPIMHGQNGQLPQKVWDHSLACAVCCQQLAESAGQDVFKAYLLGLVHDIGVVTLFNQLQQQNQEQRLENPAGAALLAQLIGRWAPQLAYWIAQDWQLPTEIVRALASQDTAAPSGETPLGQLLRRANCISEGYLLLREQQLERDALVQMIAALQCPATLLDQLDAAFTVAIGTESNVRRS